MSLLTGTGGRRLRTPDCTECPIVVDHRRHAQAVLTRAGEAVQPLELLGVLCNNRSVLQMRRANEPKGKNLPSRSL